jgi:hypothetical protein
MNARRSAVDRTVRDGARRNREEMRLHNEIKVTKQLIEHHRNLIEQLQNRLTELERAQQAARRKRYLGF